METCTELTLIGFWVNISVDEKGRRRIVPASDPTFDIFTDEDPDEGQKVCEKYLPD